MDFFHQEMFQGAGRKEPYFEGWYIRIVTANGRSLSFIPGISLCSGDSHCFIQIIDSQGGSKYISRPVLDFEYSLDKFFIKVGESTFTEDGFKIEITGKDNIHGTALFKNKVKYPKSIAHPGIMGPFSYLPILECKHDVIFMRFGVEGEIILNGEKVSFNGAVGYIEKDWGSSFPEPYIWAQSNHFGNSDASFMLSVAKVTVLGMQFTGIISYLYNRGKVYNIATYNGAFIKAMNWGGNAGIVVKEPKYSLEIDLRQGESFVLKAPSAGTMNREVKESGDGVIELALKQGAKTIFYGHGVSAGIELCGDINKLY